MSRDDKSNSKAFSFGTFLPYGRQSVDEDDIAAVVEVLRSPWLTTGPTVAAFENALAARVGSEFAVAVSSGTAALHCAMASIGIGPGDEVIVPTITFLATANSVVYQGGKPVFADVLPDSLLIDPADVERKITPRTKAIIAVDYAGQPCDYGVLREIASRHGLILVADACHSLGASHYGQPVGSLADITVFSFHPVKLIAAGEGGMLVTDNAAWAEFSRTFRNHGMTVDHRQRLAEGLWRYDMPAPGYNYRMSDIHAALGFSQLRKLEQFLARRRLIATTYANAFNNSTVVKPLSARDTNEHAWHLYVVAASGGSREDLFHSLRDKGIGVNVHYYPVHLQSYYRNAYDTAAGDCPVAEAVAQNMLSIPIFPGMSEEDAQIVIDAINSFSL